MKTINPIHAIVTVSLVLAVLFQLQAEYFIYLRDVMWSQPWRFMTAHFVHVGWIHYALNMFALACLPFIFPRLSAQYLLIALLSLPIFMSLCFYYFYPQVDAYAGFSGVLHGLYTLAAIQGLTIYSERHFALFILVGLAAKLAWEAVVGELSLTMRLIGSPVLIEAHQLGVIGAVLLCLIGFGIHYFYKKVP